MLTYGLPNRVLERRIATYPAGEVMFNLMALTGRRTRLEKRLQELEAKGELASGEEQAERVDVQDRLASIDERMKDWDTEVSQARLRAPSTEY